MFSWKISTKISTTCYMIFFIANHLNNLPLRFCHFETGHLVKYLELWILVKIWWHCEEYKDRDHDPFWTFNSTTFYKVIPIQTPRNAFSRESIFSKNTLLAPERVLNSKFLFDFDIERYSEKSSFLYSNRITTFQ